jgi:hypothetical protein
MEKLTRETSRVVIAVDGTDKARGRTGTSMGITLSGSAPMEVIAQPAEAEMPSSGYDTGSRSIVRFYKRMNSIFGTYEDSPADDAPRSESSPCVCFLLL